MFKDTKFNADISGWKVSSTCDLENMFTDNYDFCPAAGFGCGEGWANAIIKQNDIPGCTVDFTCSDKKLRNLNIRDAISKLYDPSTSSAAVAARNGITSTYGVIANWDTSRVTNMEKLFASISSADAKKVWNADLSNWDTSRVITMKTMFGAGLPAFNSVLAAWNVGNVINMDSSKL